ncbi:MAG: histidine phosphatase family protein [Betaproteobacteria bacterium]|nr:histidine phosphatase family protein [Betaproteobacteria bacterium]
MRIHTETTIHLVRHGESAANAGLATSDPGLIPLTPRGQVQAVQLAEMLEVTPSRVITSNYVRAIDTAKPYAARHSLQPIQRELLHEFVTLDPDSVAGTTNLERRPLVDKYWRDCEPTLRMGGGAETFLEFAQRVDDFLSQLNTLPHHTVVFGHGMWFAMLLWRTMGFPVKDHLAMRSFRAFQLGLPMPNCAVYELHGMADAWRIRFNERVSRHMPSVSDPAYVIQ